ncbi:hypothetical protein GUA87_06150 [Sneathiella sp. P13V-1]|uniref:hypothetical protein n=1 Tax=Sneathiella sp. P13V-1 TaxID=2697366 RepID=UPI00187B9E53|nr:hypothetical protein [Sneathiella sp. P13V-1]MBE7636420.1 hypothetical protein [Sneathiella sp. P13V-1]
MQRRTVNPFQLLKSASVGALTGIVFAIVFLAVPGALLLFVAGTLDLAWDLSWIPDVMDVILIGAIAGGGLAIALFIKDQYVPYVEEVQDFEEEAERDIKRH